MLRRITLLNLLSQPSENADTRLEDAEANFSRLGTPPPCCCRPDRARRRRSSPAGNPRRCREARAGRYRSRPPSGLPRGRRRPRRSEEHTSELQSLMRISYAVFCLTKKKKTKTHTSMIQLKQ